MEKLEESRLVHSDFLTDEEYKTYWYKLEDLRKKISESFSLSAGTRILDVGTGYALFAVEMAEQVNDGEIVGIDIADNGIIKSRKFVKQAGVEDVISIIKMDAVKLSFQNGCFDLATSFLGMRDVYMTRGKLGVKKAIEEMIRVVKPFGRIILCLTPPEDMETEDQRLAVKLEGDIFGAKSLPKKFYSDIFDRNHFALKKTRAFFTNKKMTADQTRIEFKDGIEIARKIYNRKVPSFKDVWAKYGGQVEASGYGMYSKIVTVEAIRLK